MDHTTSFDGEPQEKSQRNGNGPRDKERDTYFQAEIDIPETDNVSPITASILCVCVHSVGNDVHCGH